MCSQLSCSIKLLLSVNVSNSVSPLTPAVQVSLILEVSCCRVRVCNAAFSQPNGALVGSCLPTPAQLSIITPFILAPKRLELVQKEDVVAHHKGDRLIRYDL